jgi:4-oxalocrotonate tautomerase
MSHCPIPRWTVPAAGPAEPKEATIVPMIEVKLYDRRVTEESVPKMIEALTNALAETSGASPDHIQVVIQGVDPKHWGIAGKQQS